MRPAVRPPAAVGALLPFSTSQEKRPCSKAHPFSFWPWRSVPPGWPRPKMSTTTFPCVISNWSKAACRSDPTTTNWRYYQRLQAMEPYAVVEGPGEAYLTGPGTDGRLLGPSVQAPQPDSRQNHILLCAPEGKEIKGRLVLRQGRCIGHGPLAVCRSRLGRQARGQGAILPRQAGPLRSPAVPRHSRRGLVPASGPPGPDRVEIATRQSPGMACPKSVWPGRTGQHLRPVHRRPGDQREPAARSDLAATRRERNAR